MNNLDKNLLELICLYLDDRSLKSLIVSCKTLHKKITEQESLWLKKLSEPIETNEPLHVYYWKTQSRCQYIFMRGRDRGKRCKERVSYDGIRRGSDKYCIYCINKLSVQLRLSRMDFA